MNLTSEKLDMHEFKMTLFDNGNPEDLILVVQNFNMALKASGTLASNSKLHYFHTLLHCE